MINLLSVSVLITVLNHELFIGEYLVLVYDRIELIVFFVLTTFESLIPQPYLLLVVQLVYGFCVDRGAHLLLIILRYENISWLLCRWWKVNCLRFIVFVFWTRHLLIITCWSMTCVLLSTFLLDKLLLVLVLVWLLENRLVDNFGLINRRVRSLSSLVTKLHFLRSNTIWLVKKVQALGHVSGLLKRKFWLGQIRRLLTEMATSKRFWSIRPLYHLRLIQNFRIHNHLWVRYCLRLLLQFVTYLIDLVLNLLLFLWSM